MLNFDLTSASTPLGDTWMIVSSDITTTFDGTFAVEGFTESSNV